MPLFATHTPQSLGFYTAFLLATSERPLLSILLHVTSKCWNSLGQVPGPFSFIPTLFHCMHSTFPCLACESNLHPAERLFFGPSASFYFSVISLFPSQRDLKRNNSQVELFTSTLTSRQNLLLLESPLPREAHHFQASCPSVS